MGGLALQLFAAFWCGAIGIEQKSYTPKQTGLLFWANRLDPQCYRSIASSSEDVSSREQDTLLFGKPLRASSTKGVLETHTWPRIMNLGTVKMMKIGQPACLSSTSDLAGYDEASETERVSVDNDGLAIQSLLKIQSIPLGKLRGSEIPTKQLHKPLCTKHNNRVLPILFEKLIVSM
jgi:hypothetical protein